MAGYQRLSTKVGILVSANINAIVNRALAANNLAVFEEYLNRANAELAALQAAEGFERGRAKTLTRQIASLEAEAARNNEQVDRLLLKGERELAAARQSLLNTRRNLIVDLQAGLEEAQAEVERLSRDRARLQSRISLTQAKRLELQSLLQRKKAAEMRARDNAGFSCGSGYISQAQAVVERVREETEVALGRAESVAIDPLLGLEEMLDYEDVEEQLSEREARLRSRSAPEAAADVEP